ncbi:YceI family protein, partial [Leucobacter sp. M11]|uniref:YceI family protein n=1 Tax=Leucobacter sp. M11 TaxID=2993565 RepID=UPI002D804ED9
EDGYGQYKAGFTATTVVKREDFGLTWNNPLGNGRFVLGPDVTINLDIQAVLQP